MAQVIEIKINTINIVFVVPNINLQVVLSYFESSGINDIEQNPIANVMIRQIMLATARSSETDPAYFRGIWPFLGARISVLVSIILTISLFDKPYLDLHSLLYSMTGLAQNRI